MARIYDTVDQARALGCPIILSEIFRIGGLDGQGGEIFQLNSQIQSNNALGIPTEFLRNELQDLEADLGILQQASVAENCVQTGGGPITAQPSIRINNGVNTIDFGSVPTNDFAEGVIEIENNGSADLKIYQYTQLTNASFIPIGTWPTMTVTNPYVLKAGDKLPLPIKFIPQSDQLYTFPLEFYTNVTATNGANIVNLVGIGTQPQDPGDGSIVLGKKKTGSTRTFVLKNLRESIMESRNNPQINSQFFDARPTKNNVKLVADIYQCYTEPNKTTTTQKKVLENVVIGEGIGSFWYENCQDFIGGLLPVYQYYYDLSKIIDIRTWKANTNMVDATGINQNVGINTLDNPNAVADAILAGREDARTVINKLKAVADEIEDGNAFWGKNTSPCEKFDGNTNKYITELLNNKDNDKDRPTFYGKSMVKVYDGRNDQRQTRSTTITNRNRPDLVSPISGFPERTINYAYFSNGGYGRLECLSPKSGCFIVSQTAIPNQTRPVGDIIVKLAKNGRSPLPEQIPSDPCYRGYRTKYISGTVWEQYWEVQLNCLGDLYPEYEWRIDDALFEKNGTHFEVWEDVEFAGTEIGFNDVCNPKEVAKEQDPYIEASDIRGCYQLHTSKIFHKYPDYKIQGMDDYIKGPEVLTTQDYSGLGPGIKLNRKIQRADCIDTPIKVYHPLAVGRDIIAGRDSIETRGLFNFTQSLLSYSTSSIQSVETKKYHYDIVDETRLINGLPISYFSVAYGSKAGSGSLYEGYELNDSPTRAIYSQHRLLTLEPFETEFQVYNNGILSSNEKDVYIISFNRDSLIDRIDPGNFEISLKNFTNSDIMTFIDNSNDLLETEFSTDFQYTSFDIVSGSLTKGVHPSGSGDISTNTTFTSYGKVYPTLGIIIFDAKKLDDELGFNTNRASNVDGDNAYKLFTAISGAAALGYPMKARNSTTKKSNYYYIRVNTNASNYTNNPTMVNPPNFVRSLDEIKNLDDCEDKVDLILQLMDNKPTTDGNFIKNEYFKLRPTTYITTVGLYNDANELLAVAKVSKPIMKTPDKDILIKIRLNW